MSPGKEAIIDIYEYKPLANFIRLMKAGELALIKAADYEMQVVVVDYLLNRNKTTWFFVQLVSILPIP